MGNRLNGIAMAQVARVFRDGTLVGMSDRQILAQFVECHDEMAFEAILTRHGPMVRRVCPHVEVGSPYVPNQILPDLEDGLRKAHADAERTAEKLTAAPEIRKMKQPVYVLHERSASKVYVGSFDSPNDPNARAVRNELIQVAYDLSSKKQRGVAAIDRMIVPAVALTDVSEIKARISN